MTMIDSKLNKTMTSRDIMSHDHVTWSTATISRVESSRNPIQRSSLPLKTPAQSMHGGPVNWTPFVYLGLVFTNCIYWGYRHYICCTNQLNKLIETQDAEKDVGNRNLLERQADEINSYVHKIPVTGDMSRDMSRDIWDRKTVSCSTQNMSTREIGRKRAGQ